MVTFLGERHSARGEMNCKTRAVCVGPSVKARTIPKIELDWEDLNRTATVLHLIACPTMLA